MEIILLDSIENLGGLGDRVNVRPGYARNYLFPTGKAKFATAENIAAFEARRAELEKAAQDTQVQAEARLERGDVLGSGEFRLAGGEQIITCIARAHVDPIAKPCLLYTSVAADDLLC